jgi:adenine phosphoribosyltransferase
MNYKELIRDLPDYPVEGVVFRDLSTLWKEGDAFKKSIQDLVAMVKDLKVDKIAGIEARGFIIGSAMAYEMGLGFIPIRKKGKLPSETYMEEYTLEYGVDFIEIHRDAVEPGEKVLIVDDLLATGGTTGAAVRLLRRFPDVEVLGAAYLVELDFLKGREKLDVPVFSVIKY